MRAPKSRGWQLEAHVILTLPSPVALSDPAGGAFSGIYKREHGRVRCLQSTCAAAGQQALGAQYQPYMQAWAVPVKSAMANSLRSEPEVKRVHISLGSRCRQS